MKKWLYSIATISALMSYQSFAHENEKDPPCNHESLNDARHDDKEHRNDHDHDHDHHHGHGE